ncbi:hypothetical protein [Streptomyces bluensis]|uniref:hypothetical protein n=1 Tax=Streptomyces bluensis TaxID=33897 RepID=UPI001674A2F2|nr:hypothetical protein [Streptomyces bluensis]
MQEHVTLESVATAVKSWQPAFVPVTMRARLEHLLAVAHKPNVTINVLPFGSITLGLEKEL